LETVNFVSPEPENESGSNRPPVPTYAEIELLPPTFGLTAKLGVLIAVDIPRVIATTPAT
jgi:hypothetical protein